MKQDLELSDIANDLLIINKTTIERLFQEENKDIVILYMFYYKTAKWQNTNVIKANDEYVKKCLHWGTDKVRNLKNRLKEMELIEIDRRLNEKKQVIGWYIKLKYYKTTIPETTTPISPQVASQETNTINNNSLNTLNNNKENIDNKLSIKEKFKKPTLEEIEAYCKERNNNVDPKKFYEYYDVGNWKDSKGNKVENWKQRIITWEGRNKDKPQVQKKSKQQLVYEDLLRKIEMEEQNEQERSS